MVLIENNLPIINENDTEQSNHKPEGKQNNGLCSLFIDENQKSSSEHSEINNLLNLDSPPIPKKYNESNDTSKCIFFTCSKIMDFNSAITWTVCHDISLKNNGNNDLTNLFPACKTCSRQLGDMNKSEYELIIYKKFVKYFKL